MNDGILCSFYGKDDNCCDVGCDYISSSDVTTIIRYCSADYRACSRYQELEHRFSIRPQGGEWGAGEAPAQRYAGSAIQVTEPLIQPFQVKWSLPALWHQVISRPKLESAPLARQLRVARSLESRPIRPVPAAAVADPVSGPVPMGLLGFGVATVLLSLQMAGFFPLGTVLMTMGIFYAGLAQIVSGFMEWRKNNTFGATAFTTYGLLCLTLVAVALVTHTGLAPAPSSAATAASLGLWSLISAGLFLAALQLDRMLRVLFALLTISFVLLAISTAADLPALRLVAGYGGIATGALATCAGGVRFFKEVYSRRGFVPAPA